MEDHLQVIKSLQLTADGDLKTKSGGATDIGPCSYIHISNRWNKRLVKLHDSTDVDAGSLEFNAKFGSEVWMFLYLVVV